MAARFSHRIRFGKEQLDGYRLESPDTQYRIPFGHGDRTCTRVQGGAGEYTTIDYLPGFFLLYREDRHWKAPTGQSQGRPEHFPGQTGREDNQDQGEGTLYLRRPWQGEGHRSGGRGHLCPSGRGGL